MARKPDRTGRNPQTHFVSFDRAFLETPAWRALSLAGKAVYPFVRLEWHGPNHNNNGKIRLSVRQAAECAGINMNTAARAFQDLQAKGFLIVTRMGCLGSDGEARGPSFEITEHPMPGADRQSARRLFAQWQKGQDFPVVKHNANNPKGVNKSKNPSPKSGQERVQNEDVQ
jgi:hypothetical protein